MARSSKPFQTISHQYAWLQSGQPMHQPSHRAISLCIYIHTTSSQYIITNLPVADRSDPWWEHPCHPKTPAELSFWGMLDIVPYHKAKSLKIKLTSNGIILLLDSYWTQDFANPWLMLSFSMQSSNHPLPTAFLGAAKYCCHQESGFRWHEITYQSHHQTCPCLTQPTASIILQICSEYLSEFQNIILNISPYCSNVFSIHVKAPQLDPPGISSNVLWGARIDAQAMDPTGTQRNTQEKHQEIWWPAWWSWCW